jgi:hypothetical protein
MDIALQRGPWVPCPAIEDLFPVFDKRARKEIGDLLLKSVSERLRTLWRGHEENRRGGNILAMSGSLANYGSKAIEDSMWGKTAFTAATTIYFGLWTSTLDDTFNGATASEAAYTSYARLGLTNNTTIFAAGSGTTTYTKTFPSDATKSFATSTGSTSTVTYLGILDGNAGSSSDHGYAWCSVTSTTINSGDTPQLAQNAITVVQD